MMGDIGGFVRPNFLSCPEASRHWTLGALDAAILAFAIWAAVSLRLGEFYVPDSWSNLAVIAISVACGSLTFMRAGLYRQVVRYMDAASNLRIVYGVTVTMMSLGLPSRPLQI